MTPDELTSGTHSAPPLKIPHSDVSTQRQRYGLACVGVAWHTPWPLKTPPLLVGSQQAVPPLQSEDDWQTTPQL